MADTRVLPVTVEQLAVRRRQVQEQLDVLRGLPSEEHLLGELAELDYLLGADRG